MNVFGRRKRVYLGAYASPEEHELPPIEHVIDDGVSIATSAVRMAVKNHLIVDALRDDRTYDPERLAAVASDELLELARQNDDSAARVWKDGDWQDEPEDGDEHLRRRSIFLGLASALRAMAADPVALGRLVGAARDAAWEEIGGVVTAKLSEPGVVEDSAYEAEREGRIRAFTEIDLARLTKYARFRDAL